MKKIILLLCVVTASLQAQQELSQQQKTMLKQRVQDTVAQLGKGNDQEVFKKLSTYTGDNYIWIEDITGENIKAANPLIVYRVPYFLKQGNLKNKAALPFIVKNPNGGFLQYPWPEECLGSLKESYLEKAHGDNGAEYIVGSGLCLSNTIGHAYG